MVADPTKPVERQHGYRNALHGVYRMVQQEGPSSLARGLMPNTVSDSSLLSTDGLQAATLAQNLAFMLVDFDRSEQSS